MYKRHNTIIRIIIIAILLGIGWLFYRSNNRELEFTVLKSPANITIRGDSAKYVGYAQYEVYTTLINRTGKPLVYTPVFGIIKDKSGRKLGLAMGNTGRFLGAGETAHLIMDTIIPRESGNPAIIELYAE
jgi:hypothetical protein